MNAHGPSFQGAPTESFLDLQAKAFEKDPEEWLRGHGLLGANGSAAPGEPRPAFFRPWPGWSPPFGPGSGSPSPYSMASILERWIKAREKISEIQPAMT